MLGRKSIDLLEQGLHGFVTQGEGMAGLTTLLSSSIEIMDGMIEETSWYTTNDIICAKKKYSSTLISINLRMTQYAWKRCCWHCNIWSDWLILIWRLVETIRIGSHLDHLAENVRDDCYEFFLENQSSIHYTHSLQKALALMVHHLHPLEQSRPYLKFCFENNIYNNELTLPLHVNTVIEKMSIIF